ncbi:MAG: type II toxin-antitoxin system RatA family toxin [Burkholderiales bacterium]|nr:type II toxin-antitoxin system RatA family toxin [Burkholderiales bacterium]
MNTITRSALVGYGAEAMYALVEDIEAYPQFLPWCRSSRVIERNGDITLAELSVGLKGINQSFTTRNLNRPGTSIELELVAGPFRRFRASWRFHALGPHAAKIEYSMAYELAGGVLGRVLESLFDHIANTMVDAFIRRAEAVYGPAAD